MKRRTQHGAAASRATIALKSGSLRTEVLPHTMSPVDLIVGCNAKLLVDEIICLARCSTCRAAPETYFLISMISTTTIPEHNRDTLILK
jgi:hypothetical protein